MLRRLSRRNLLKAAGRLGVGAALSLFGLGSGRSQAQEQSEDEEPYFRESVTRLTLGNRFYEVDFDKRNGAITRIFDKPNPRITRFVLLLSSDAIHAILDVNRRQQQGAKRLPNEQPPRLPPRAAGEFDGVGGCEEQEQKGCDRTAQAARTLAFAGG